MYYNIYFEEGRTGSITTSLPTSYYQQTLTWAPNRGRSTPLTPVVERCKMLRMRLEAKVPKPKRRSQTWKSPS